MPRSRISSAAGGLLLALLSWLGLPSSVFAQQQINVGVPFRGVSNSFFEQTGFSGSLRGPGFFFNQGGFNQAAPAFGGAQPGAGVTGGLGFGGGGVSGGFGFTFGQGSRSSNVSQTGSLTMMNGVPGILSDVSQSPFVVGVVPVVGDRINAGQRLPYWQQMMDGYIPKVQRENEPPPLLQAPQEAGIPSRVQQAAQLQEQASTAAVDPANLSVAEIRRRRQAAQSQEQVEAQEKFERARQAHQEGKAAVARIYYQQALRRAEGDLKTQIEKHLQDLQAGR